jgi:hypothetical protein
MTQSQQPQQPTQQEIIDQYHALLHAMQSGVAADIGQQLPRTEDPQMVNFLKHMRVGVNSTMCDQAALVRIFVAKGLFTDAEYFQALVEEMKREVERYEKTLSERFGRPVKLI